MTQDEVKMWFGYDHIHGRLQWKKCKKTDRIGMFAGAISISKDDARKRYLVGIEGRRILHAHLVYVYFYGMIPDGMTVDHIDNDPLNDRIENLRLATPKQQSGNTRGWREKQSRLPKGVFRNRDKFAAKWRSNGKYTSRTFDTIEEAKACYDAAIEKEYGTFANSG